MGFGAQGRHLKGDRTALERQGDRMAWELLLLLLGHFTSLHSTSLHFIPLQFSPVQFSSVQFGPVQLWRMISSVHSIFRSSSVQFTSFQFSSVQFNAVQLQPMFRSVQSIFRFSSVQFIPLFVSVLFSSFHFNFSSVRYSCNEHLN